MQITFLFIHYLQIIAALVKLCQLCFTPIALLPPWQKSELLNERHYQQMSLDPPLSLLSDIGPSPTILPSSQQQNTLNAFKPVLTERTV